MLVKHVGINAVSSFLPPLAGIVVAPILARVLGAEARGQVAAALAPLLVLSSLLSLGIPESLTFHVARRVFLRRRTRVGLLAVVIAVGGVGGAGLVISSQVLKISPGGNMSLAWLMGAAVIPTLLCGVVRGYAAGLHRWNLISVENVVASVFRLAAVLSLCLTGNLTVLSAAIVLAFAPVFGGIVYVRLINQAQGTSIVRRSRRLGTILRFGFGVWPGTLVGILLARLDQMLLAPLSNDAELGLYAVAVTLSDIALIFNSSFRNVLFAAESESANDARLQLAVRVSTSATIFISGIMFFSSWWFLPHLFGIAFRGTIPVLGVLLLGGILGNPGSAAGAGLSARGRPVLRSLSLAVALAASVGVLFWLGPSYGAMGAAIATLVGNVLAGNLNILWLKLFYGFHARSLYVWRRSDYSFVADFIRLRLVRTKRVVAQNVKS